MSRFSPGSESLEYLEALYTRFRADPASLDPEWRRYFENGVNQPEPREPALGLIRTLTDRLRETGTRQDQLDRLVRAYRVRGHLEADLNPLAPPRRDVRELDPAFYGFEATDQDASFSTTTIPGASSMTLRQIVQHLRTTYCRSIGVQFMHIDDLKVKDWIQERMERSENQRGLSNAEQVHIYTKLTDAEVFEQFIHKKFVGAKRFSLQGAESLIPLLDLAIEEAGAHAVKEIVIGMAHRGRLNVLANILEKSPAQIFREFDDADEWSLEGKGDVKYHLGHSFDRTTAAGRVIHLSLAFNPSHLEFVGPVVLGRVRAKQERFLDRAHQNGLGILVHGDAAFAGQGVVQEMLNMSALPGYTTGGTIHIILNNQIGFTSLPEEVRSTQYATDVAKMLQIPIFHVNGEHPEPVAQVIKLALEFHSRFHQDVIIDLYCYRQYGHNEGDEPAFTQPLLYERIGKKDTIRQGYLKSMIAMGGLTQEGADRITEERRSRLEQELSLARAAPTRPRLSLTPPDAAYENRRLWAPHLKEGLSEEVDTGVAAEQLLALVSKLTQIPAGFFPHKKLLRVLEGWSQMGRGERPLDWAAAEALAFATLLLEGTRVRLSGQDTQRGTFSHRHCVWHDIESGQTHVPLASLAADQAAFTVWNSPLTETAALGFEYGYSLDTPDGLTVWEAQFGDFVNVAQVIIDQFISSGEEKWNRLSGLVLLLPHGYEGQGPEHSSARLERFLALAADDNLQVANPTTPAQLFHLLRRQVLQKARKPLVVMSPKSLLRHQEVTSPLSTLTRGRFRPVLEDHPARNAKLGAVQKVLLTSGKVFYELDTFRRERGIEDVALLRLERYYPFPQTALEEALAPYRPGVPLVWVQEEPKNMGAWPFLHLAHGARLADRKLSAICRPESASPATGSHRVHQREQLKILEEAFSP